MRSAKSTKRQDNFTKEKIITKTLNDFIVVRVLSKEVNVEVSDTTKAE